MDKKKEARAAASRYRSLVTASTSVGNHRSRVLHLESQLPRYDPEKEAARALELALKQKDLRYYTMYRYASLTDILMMVVGIASAIIWALTVPTILRLLGKGVEIVLDAQYCRNEISINGTSTRTFPANVFSFGVRTIFVWYTCSLCAILFISSFVAMGTFAFTAENQTFRIRLSYFESILRKDMAWLDNYVQREFGRHMTHDVTIIRKGIGGLVPYVVFCVIVVPLLLYTAFSINGIVTLGTMAVLVPTMIGVGYLSTYSEKREIKVEESLSDKAEAYAEQVLSNIKAVKLFSAEAYESKRYSLLLGESRILWKFIIYSGICVFLLWACYYFASALTLYFGRNMIAAEYLQTGCHLNPPIGSLPFPFIPVQGGGALFVIFMAVVLATLHLSEIVTLITILKETKKIAAEVFFMIDWKPRIDNLSSLGECPGAKAVGKIEFMHVSFKYPRKMDIRVLKNVSLTVHTGQLIAILGDKSCGKSTVLRLMHRLYDPTEGLIYFDGRHMESLNVGWLRSQIAHVPQKPVMFNKSIEDNVRYANWSATQFEIEDACKKAGIHDEILNLPQGYKTTVGQHGKLISLSQRKRIAFARAYIQRPKVLLLDEPITGSDKDYEEFVLATINQLRQNTTVVITASDVNSIVRQCDRIYVMDRGQILEEGNHSELMETAGLYSMMENGSAQGIPTERRLRLTSQLKSYNFAKTLRKWKLDRDRNEKEDEEQALEKRDNDDENNFYEYQRKTRGTHITLILGGFNSYHYARRNTEPYNIRDDDKGVKKAKTIGGLGIIRRRITEIKRQGSTGRNARDPINQSSSMALRQIILGGSGRPRARFSSNSSAASDVEDPHAGMELDTASIQSESDQYGEFWDEYETVLDGLDENTFENSWKDLFSVGLQIWWILIFAIILSGSLGMCSTLCHMIYGTFYEEITHSETLLHTREISPSIVNFLIVGCIAGILGFAQTAVFMMGGYKLTATLKEKLFGKLLGQELDWFDDPENDISILCHRLSIDTAAIENALMIFFGVLSQAFMGYVSSVIVVIYHSAKNPGGLNIYLIVSIPMSLIFVALLYIDGTLQTQWDKILDKTLSPVTQLELDVVVNIRTVITLGLEEHFLAEMKKVSKIVERKMLWKNFLRVLVFALTRAYPYLTYLAIGLHTLYTTDPNQSTWHLVLISELLIQNQIRTGIGIAMLPFTGPVRAAASRIKHIFYIKLPCPAKEYLTVEFANPPALSVKNLHYSCTENTINITDINFEVKSKDFLGIVGIGTDSGNSILINLLARFHKPKSGSIFLDEVDIWSMDLKSFRSQTAFIEESPSIFDLSIRENIAYGMAAETVTIEQIVKVAMEVNIHDLVIRLPQGYDTKASTIGNDDRMCGLLQRLIVARALIRNPKIIFIDGHTTSLNQEEDVLLQAAIDLCGNNRTKIVATNRIASVQNADFIIVLQDGVIVEQGTHWDLLDNKKLYYQMHINQNALAVIAAGDAKDSSTGDGATKRKRRSLLAYERYLQKRMFSQIPRATQHTVTTSTTDAPPRTRPSVIGINLL